MSSFPRKVIHGTETPPVVTATTPPVNRGAADPPRESRVVTLTTSAEGGSIPIVYGRQQVGGLYFLLKGSSSYLTVAYALGLGPWDAIESLSFNGQPLASGAAVLSGISSQQGVAFQARLGTSSQAAASLLGITRRFPGLAYVVVRISANSAAWGGIPDLMAVVRGRNDVWDPRTNSRGYTTNLALCTAHLVAHPDGGCWGESAINWAKTAEAASWFDALVNGSKRHEIGAVIQERQTVAQHVASLLAQGRAYDLWDFGSWAVGVDRDTSPVRTITGDWLVVNDKGQPVLLEETTLDTDEIPDFIRHWYTEPARGWEFAEQRFPPQGCPGGVVTELELRSPAITSAAVAGRVAEETYSERQHPRGLRLQVKRQGLVLERGDVVQVELPLCGLSEAMRVYASQPQLDGSVSLTLAELYPFSGAGDTIPTTGGGDTPRTDPKDPPTIPDPGAVPASPTALTLTVAEDTASGTKVYRLLASWTLAECSFVRGYEVRVTVAGVTRTVGQFGRYATSAEVQVQAPGELHLVQVLAVSQAGVYSLPAQATTTPGGVGGVAITAGTRGYRSLSGPSGTAMGYATTWSWTITDPAGSLDRIEAIDDLGRVVWRGPSDRASLLHYSVQPFTKDPSTIDLVHNRPLASIRGVTKDGTIVPMTGTWSMNTTGGSDAVVGVDIAGGNRSGFPMVAAIGIEGEVTFAGASLEEARLLGDGDVLVYRGEQYSGGRWRVEAAPWALPGASSGGFDATQAWLFGGG